MTPAIRAMKRHKINYDIHQYQHDVNTQSFGLEAAEKLAVDPKKIFKTLVVSTDTQQLAVAIVPVELKLNLKAMAKALKCKKVKMADTQLVEKTTGYVLGGVSPLGQKKRLTTIMDAKCKDFACIFVSGGKRGLEIELSATDLAQLTQASFYDISY